MFYPFIPFFFPLEKFHIKPYSTQFRISYDELTLQVLLTPTHLAIVMEYAAGGELFERICSAGRFGEDEVI